MKKIVLLLFLVVSIFAQDSKYTLNDYKTQSESQIKLFNNNDGTYSTTSESSKDSSGNEATNSLFGELTVGERTDNINVQFQYNNGIGVDTLEAITGTGSSDNANSMAQIHTGSGIGSYSLKSKDTNRYVTGHDVVSMFTTIYNVGVDNTIQRHVYGDDNDYVGFGYNGTVFGIWKNFGGEVEHIPMANWNYNGKNKPDGWTLNPQKLNIYWVQFGWLGIAPIQMKIYGGASVGWVTVHTFDTPNLRDKPHLSNPVLPITAYVSRTSGSGDIVLKTASWRAGIIGKKPSGTLADRPDVLFISKTIVGGNVNVPIVTIRNGNTFQGKVNHVKVRYGTVNIASDGTKAVRISVFRNGTLTGGIYNFFDSTRTPVEYNITATSYSGTNLIGGALLGKVDTNRINLFSDDVVIPIYPNETVTLTASSTNASDIELFLRVLSEF